MLMMLWSNLAVLLLGGSLTFVLWPLLRVLLPRRGRFLSLPPGPRRLPLFGNLLDIPIKNQWLTFTKWYQAYGPVCYVNALGRHIVIIHSYEALYELLIKQSKTTSNRTHSIMVNDIMGWSFATTFLNYGDLLRSHRSLLYKYLQPRAVEKYTELQTEMAHKLLGNFLETPKNFMHHIRRSASATVMMLAYGHRVAHEDDKYITLADHAIKLVSDAGVPGRYWVDFLPWLQYFPDWFPGTKWKADGKAGYDAMHNMYYVPYNDAKSMIMKDKRLSCVLAEVLRDNGENHAFDEPVIISCMGSIYGGGSDTTVGLLESAVLAFVLDPGIVHRAQEELDRVIGSNRLPTFEDRESLPYIEGILREALRWNPVLPLAVPHEINREEIYEGYRIPSGSTIVPNIWGMLHDECIYSDPFRFYPERWLDKDGNLLDMIRAPMHPNKVVFGFGRRICPGRHFAENSLFITIVSMIATFNFDKVKNSNGVLLVPDVNFSSGLVSEPEPFECLITPRSLRAIDLIHQTLEPFPNIS